MSETLPLPEGEPFSPMQQLGAHIDRVFAAQPAKPNAPVQTITRHILGNKGSTVVYELKPASGNCEVTLTLSPPLYRDPLNTLNPKKYEGGRTVTISYQNPAADVIEVGEQHSTEFYETTIASLLAIEPMLTKRSGLLGIMELYLRHRRKQS